MSPAVPRSLVTMHPGPIVARLALGAVFVTSMLWITRHYVAQPFRYLGYVERSATWIEPVTASVLTLVLISSCTATWRRPSDGAYSFLVLTVAIPVTWIPIFYGTANESVVLTAHLAVGLCFAALQLCLMGQRRPVAPLVMSPVTYWSFLVLAIVAGVSLLVVGLGLRPELLNFSDVYDQRADFKAAGGSLGSYVVGILVNAVLPVFLCLGLLWKRLLPLFVAVAGYLLLFSLTGQKSFVVGALLSAAGVFLVTRFKASGLGWFWVLTATMWVGVIVDALTGSITGSSLLTRRAITTSGINSAYYFDYFSVNDAYGLRHSVLSFLGPSPYSSPPAQLVGTTYYGPGTAANANIVADGFANFGIVGCVLAGLVFGLGLRFYDKLTMHLPLAVSLPALTLVLIAASNTAVLTVLATHGGILLAIVMAVLPTAARTSSGADRRQERLAQRSRRPLAVKERRTRTMSPL